jgi:Asp-tRNA(Asn)/Glu-tRNA(Gln) amidotransferase A subunit family amidase
MTRDIRQVLRTTDGLGIAELIRSKALSSGEVLEASVSLIEELNPHVNAVTVPLMEHAAQRLSEGLPSGPFTGVPMLLKDVAASSYKGAPCTLSSRLLEDNIADYDADIVVRYKQAGAQILGRTNLPNFGPSVSTESVFRGPARNPWNLSKMTGGSSGGSAAAVGCGMVPIAHATDAAGSLRIPAAHCGLVGLKTTRGRNPAGPKLNELAAGLGTAHVLTRSVRDTAAMLDATRHPMMVESSVPPEPSCAYLSCLEAKPNRLRIAVCFHAFDSGNVDPSCRDGVVHAAKLCEMMGHVLEEASPQFDFHKIRRHFALAHGGNWWPMVRALLQKLGRDPVPEEIEPGAYHWAELGARNDAASYADALKQLQDVARQISYFFNEFDVLLTPTTPAPAYALGTLTMMEPDFEKYCDDLFRHAVFTVPFNCTGQPAISLPLWWTADGTPVGVQCIGRFGREDVLLQLARALEQASNQFERPIQAELQV